MTDAHDRSLAQWTMVPGDGTVVGTGASFATYDAAGALTSMTGLGVHPCPSIQIGRGQPKTSTTNNATGNGLARER